MNLVPTKAILQATLESTSEGILVVTHEQEVVYCNRRFQEIWRLPADWRTSLPSFDAFVDFLVEQTIEPEQHRRRIAGMMTEPEIEETALVVFRDGRVGESVGRPYRVDGMVVGRVWSHRAITERHRAEITLSESRAQLQTIIDNAPVGIGLLDSGWRFHSLNQRWADLLGYTPDEALQLTLLDVAHPDDALARRERLQALAQGVIPRYHRETRLLHSDGGTFWGDLLVAPIRNEQGDIEAFVAIVADITERKQSEQQSIQQQQVLATIRERERLARELHDSVGQVLGYVNTQAQSIRAMLGDGQTADADAALEDLIRVAQDAHADIREFILGVNTGASAWHRPAQQGPFRATLAQYLQRFSQLAGVPVELIAAPDLSDVLLPPAIETQLLRIIQESLTNVRKHACARRVQIAVTIVEGQMQVAIQDDGRGFHVPADLADLAEHYGLRGMHERAAEIGGELQIVSAGGLGTTTCVRVPLQQPEQRRPQTILLVDDHPLFLEGLQNLLRSHGLQVVGTAHDGREALAQARALRPDVILMDIEMPHLNGIEATRLIKAEFPEIRIVMLTTASDDAHLMEAIKAGASGYLFKNLNAAEFFDLLEDLAQGEAPLAPGLAARLLRELTLAGATELPPLPTNSESEHQLNARQVEVLRLVARGLTYKEVGNTLSISERTVRYHMDEIIKRLHVGSRTEAIAYAARLSPPA